MIACTYCNCPAEGTKMINGWFYCNIHFEHLSTVPVVDQIRGHVSQYAGEDEEEDMALGGDGTCKSCGVLIMWKKTKNGKRMPIEYNPDLNGDSNELFDPTRMVSHFDNCAHADEHRNR